MVRGSNISRIIAWFKEGDYEEVRYVVERGNTIADERIPQSPQPKAPKAVVHRRKRRTAAQIMADAAAADAQTTAALSAAAGE